MTNIDRAAEVLWLPEPHLSTSECDDQARELAQALADATPPLLMPDLPEPDGFCDWDMDPLAVRIAKAARKIYLAYLDPYEGQQISMFPDQAREVAYALLSAASYAERNQA